MKQLRYIKRLEPLLCLPSFSTADAEKEGIPRHALLYLVELGKLERVYPGIYRSVTYEPQVDFQWENLAFMAASIPGSVICLISALCYYDLTDQIMRELWIAIPHKSHAPKRPNTRVIRMRNLDLGKTEVVMGEYKLRIFDRERTIVDAYRYLGKEIAIKAIRKYFQTTNPKPQPKKLNEYAKALRVDLTPYILAYTT